MGQIIIIICVGECNHVTLTVGTKVPWNESSRERKFQGAIPGAKVRGNESSIIRGQSLVSADLHCQ